MQLREFHSPDLEALSRIDEACFPANIAYSRRELESFIAQPSSKTWVAAEGDTIAGFLIADRQAQEAGHIITIDVVEDRRRRGVGTQLMQAAETWADALGLRMIYLETAEHNHTAQRFYEARGYRKTKKIRRYYADGANAWVMVKHLGNNRASKL